MMEPFPFKIAEKQNGCCRPTTLTRREGDRFANGHCARGDLKGLARTVKLLGKQHGIVAAK